MYSLRYLEAFFDAILIILQLTRKNKLRKNEILVKNKSSDL